MSTRIRIILVAVLIVTLCGATTGPAGAEEPQPGSTIVRTFTNDAGSRDYRLFVPDTGGVDVPLVIWLHGCGGPLDGYAIENRAAERGFAVALPVQPATANAQQCWNWFDDAHQHRGAGEPSIIAGITTDLVDELGSDPDRVYIAGYSAGGAMTSVMGASYPDLYAAIAPSAGAPYALDPTGRAALAEMGPRARAVPAFVLQGIADEISIYPIGRTNILQWLSTNDRADDGRRNYSVPRFPTSVHPVLPAHDLPSPLLVEDYETATGCAIGQFVTMPLEHLTAGALLYYEIGSGLQNVMLDFLFQHQGARPGPPCI